jgi:hypothetical protein
MSVFPIKDFRMKAYFSRKSNFGPSFCLTLVFLLLENVLRFFVKSNIGFTIAVGLGVLVVGLEFEVD